MQRLLVSLMMASLFAFAPALQAAERILKIYKSCPATGFGAPGTLCTASHSVTTTGFFPNPMSTLDNAITNDSNTFIVYTTGEIDQGLNARREEILKVQTRTEELDKALKDFQGKTLDELDKLKALLSEELRQKIVQEITSTTLNPLRDEVEKLKTEISNLKAAIGNNH